MNYMVWFIVPTPNTFGKKRNSMDSVQNQCYKHQYNHEKIIVDYCPCFNAWSKIFIQIKLATNTPTNHNLRCGSWFTGGGHTPVPCVAATARIPPSTQHLTCWQPNENAKNAPIIHVPSCSQRAPMHQTFAAFWELIIMQYGQQHLFPNSQHQRVG